MSTRRARSSRAPDQKRSTAAGVDARVAAAEPARRTSTGSRRCRSRTPCRRGVRRGRARPARARSRDRRSRPSARARRRRTRRAAGPPGRCPGSTVTSVRAAGAPRGQRAAGRGAARRRYTVRAVPAKRGRWKPVPQPRSSTTRPAQSARAAHRGLEEAVGVDGVVLELVRRGVLPDVRARDAARRSAGMVRACSLTRAAVSDLGRSDPDQPVRGLELGGDDARACRSGRPTRP